ncbi:MAG: hypothetical protein QM703_22005 [Gemmatales bacterium]
MKTSITTAAIRCAAAGRNAVRGRKFGMGRLARTSYLSQLHLPVFCSVEAGYSLFRSHAAAITGASEVRGNGQPCDSMPTQDSWQPGEDSRMAGTRRTMMVKPSQKNQTLKALALA